MIGTSLYRRPSLRHITTAPAAVSADDGDVEHEPDRGSEAPVELRILETERAWEQIDDDRTEPLGVRAWSLGLVGQRRPSVHRVPQDQRPAPDDRTTDRGQPHVLDPAGGG